MNFKLSVLLMLFGISFWVLTTWLMAQATAIDSALYNASVVLLILGGILIVVGFVGGIVGIAREKLGNRNGEGRKEKYDKAHPEESDYRNTL